MFDSDSLRVFKIGFPIVSTLAFCIGTSVYLFGGKETVLGILFAVLVIGGVLLFYLFCCLAGAIMDDFIEPWLRERRGKEND